MCRRFSELKNPFAENPTVKDAYNQISHYKHGISQIFDYNAFTVIDKPMKGHTIIQAISRVNRVFSDKPHGLIVDYIGIGYELREATGTYTAGGGRGEPAPEVTEHAIPVFMECREEILQYLPDGINYGDWRNLTHIEIEDR